MAATTKFDEHISLATAINVRGTAEILELARECEHLEALTHVSTAYSNCNRKDIDEVFYEPPVNPEKLMELVERTPNNVLDKMLPE